MSDVTDLPELGEAAVPVPALGGRQAVLATVAARGFAIAATFALSVVVARSLGVAGAGTYFALLAVVTLFAGIGRWGTDTLALKTVAAAGASSRSAAWTLVALGTAVSTALCLVLVVVAPLLFGRVFDPSPSSTAIVLAILSIVPTSAYLGAAGILRGSGRVAEGAMAELGSTPTLATLAILGLSGTTGVDLTAVFACYLGASGATAAWSLLAARSALADRPRGLGEPRATFTRRNAPNLTSICGSATLFYALTWAPAIVLGLVSSADQVGYLAAATRIAAFVSLAAAIQVTYLAPRFAALHASGRIDDLNRLAGRSAAQAVGVGAVPAVVILLFPEWCLHIFGSDFASAAEPLRILAVGAVVVCALGQPLIIMVTCGYEHTALVLTAAAVAVAVALMLAVGGTFGATGVAIVTAVVTIAYGLAASLVLRSRAGIAPWMTTQWKG